jgi:hypothetical protein
MAQGILTPLQLIAGESLLQNTGIGVAPSLTAAEVAYSNTPTMSAFFQALAATGNTYGLPTLAANSTPAFSDSVPCAYENLGVQMIPVITAKATYDAGSGDISKFVQALGIVQSYTETTNQFINSAVNSQTYLADTFTTTNDAISADVTEINLATQAFATDLANLGYLINLSNLENLGSPLALIQQIYSVTGAIPSVSVVFVAAGIPTDVVLNLTNPTASVSDSIQRLMYVAMTQITGVGLQQILQVLGVKTIGINTMADLLNPVMLFPNSFQSMTVPTSQGPQAIYLNSSGSVNTTLESQLPVYVISSLV